MSIWQSGLDSPMKASMIARQLAPNWRVLCASPDYLARYGEPQTPADLVDHKFIVLVTSAGPLNTFHFVVDGQEWNHTVPMSQAWETS